MSRINSLRPVTSRSLQQHHTTQSELKSGDNNHNNHNHYKNQRKRRTRRHQKALDIVPPNTATNSTTRTRTTTKTDNTDESSDHTKHQNNDKNTTNKCNNNNNTNKKNKDKTDNKNDENKDKNNKNNKLTKLKIGRKKPSSKAIEIVRKHAQSNEDIAAQIIANNHNKNKNNNNTNNKHSHSLNHKPPPPPTRPVPPLPPNSKNSNSSGNALHGPPSLNTSSLSSADASISGISGLSNISVNTPNIPNMSHNNTSNTPNSISIQNNNHIHNHNSSSSPGIISRGSRASSAHLGDSMTTITIGRRGTAPGNTTDSSNRSSLSIYTSEDDIRFDNPNYRQETPPVPKGIISNERRYRARFESLLESMLFFGVDELTSTNAASSIDRYNRHNGGIMNSVVSNSVDNFDNIGNNQIVIERTRSTPSANGNPTYSRRVIATSVIAEETEVSPTQLR